MESCREKTTLQSDVHLTSQIVWIMYSSMHEKSKTKPHKQILLLGGLGKWLQLPMFFFAIPSI